jgi:hypothetical protein
MSERGEPAKVLAHGGDERLSSELRVRRRRRALPTTSPPETVIFSMQASVTDACQPGSWKF